jgi:hypothetical protein
MKITGPAVSLAISVMCILPFLASLPAEAKESESSVIGYENKKKPDSNNSIAIRIIPSVNGSFGYDIYKNGKMAIHQPSMPGLPGNEGFRTKEAAQKVAEFVVKKMRNNQMPPTVRLQDLRNMGVLDQARIADKNKIKK